MTPTDTDSASPEDRSVHAAARREKLAKIREMGIDPWGSRFDDRLLVSDLRERADQVKYRLESGEEIELPDLDDDPDERINLRQWRSDQGPGEEIGPTVRAAGRIQLQRDKGKLRFVDIEDWSGRIQLFIGLRQVGDDAFELAGLFDLGDIIGVEGRLGRTNTGELTIFAEQLYFLTKSLEPPPAKHLGLVDPDLRQRMRYVDLAYNPGTRERFLNRTRIVQSIRSTLADHDFIEIEGPTLHTIAGGAAAKPFITHHNTLDMQLTMRIALELHLKRLLVGGMERVYEMGRVYRNEGISPRHNPEFTMLEVYQAFGNYESMMDLSETIIADAIGAIGGGDKLPWGEEEIDFSTPFPRARYHDLFQQHTGVDPADSAAVATLAGSLGIETGKRHPDVIKNDLFEEKV
ncbi:MAG: amino acid--tRNA ligase-related protein, partial [Pirellulaceae bacterium]